MVSSGIFLEGVRAGRRERTALVLKGRKRKKGAIAGFVPREDVTNRHPTAPLRLRLRQRGRPRSSATAGNTGHQASPTFVRSSAKSQDADLAPSLDRLGRGRGCSATSTRRSITSMSTPKHANIPRGAAQQRRTGGWKVTPKRAASIAAQRTLT